MKKIIFTVLAFSSTQVFAQKKMMVQLKKGQVIHAASNINMDMEMMMGMQMKNATSMQNKLVVIDETDSTYVLSNTLTKMSASMEAMGQQNAYDSEKEADRNSDMGKAMGKNLNIPDTVIISRLSGLPVFLSEKKPVNVDEGAPMSGLMEMFGSSNSDQTISNAFFILPADVKVGDKWADSSLDKGTKSTRFYEVTSIKNGLAKIQLTGTVSGTTEQEIQGNSMTLVNNTKLSGEIMVNINNMLVTERMLTADTEGSMEVMGQTMNMNSKTVSTSSFQ